MERSTYLPVIVLGALCTIGYMSLRARSMDNRDRILQLEAAAAKASTRIGELERTAPAPRLPDAPTAAAPGPMRVGPITWRLPAGWTGEANTYLQAAAQSLLDRYAAFDADTPVPKGRAIAMELRIDEAGTVPVFKFVKAPADEALATGIETLVRGHRFPAPPPAVATAFRNKTVQLSIEP